MTQQTSVLTFDWKERPYPEDIEQALKVLGVDIHVTEADTESDQYGYVLSMGPMTKEQVQAAWTAYDEASFG